KRTAYWVVSVSLALGLSVSAFAQQTEATPQPTQVQNPAPNQTAGKKDAQTQKKSGTEADSAAKLPEDVKVTDAPVQDDASQQDQGSLADRFDPDRHALSGLQELGIGTPRRASGGKAKTILTPSFSFGETYDTNYLSAPGA